MLSLFLSTSLVLSLKKESPTSTRVNLSMGPIEAEEWWRGYLLPLFPLLWWETEEKVCGGVWGMSFTLPVEGSQPSKGMGLDSKHPHQFSFGNQKQFWRSRNFNHDMLGGRQSPQVILTRMDTPATPFFSSLGSRRA